MARTRALFTTEFLAARRGGGSPARDPIFIVGLPRSGSTLVEQILASHSQVEGTMELPDLLAIVQGLDRAPGSAKDRGAYPESVAGLSAAELAALGEDYLARTRIHRRTERPLFIDKLPNNWLHVGLIQLILPNATIIDARRHPLGCCLSGFKQHFARGQAFTYDLAGIGRYYRDYVALMAHFDAVSPGKIHRVIYERMVADTEREVRALLDHVGLPFEEACLRFWTNDRAVRTASSEQVRQPIFDDAVDHWRNFEPWLGPLKDALGPVLDAYPDAPAELGRPCAPSVARRYAPSATSPASLRYSVEEEEVRPCSSTASEAARGSGRAAKRADGGGATPRLRLTDQVAATAQSNFALIFAPMNLRLGQVVAAGRAPQMPTTQSVLMLSTPRLLMTFWAKTENVQLSLPKPADRSNVANGAVGPSAASSAANSADVDWPCAPRSPSTKLLKSWTSNS